MLFSFLRWYYLPTVIVVHPEKRRNDVGNKRGQIQKRSTHLTELLTRLAGVFFKYFLHGVLKLS
jgi:hypothetical protein